MTTKRKGGPKAQKNLLDRLVARMPSLGEELTWATGGAVSLTGAEPPQWVKKTILRVLGHGYLRPLSECNPATAGPLGAAQLGQLLGAVQIFVGMLISPDAKHLAEEKKTPEIAEWRGKIVAAGETMLTVKPRAKAKEGKVLPKISAPEAAVKFISGLKKGATQAMGADAGFEGQPIFFQLGLCFWIFWPEVEQARNRRDLALWLHSLGVACSFPTVEKFCREVGLKLAPRGRAKKMLLSRKKP